jgi:hypothetical protein
LIQEIKFLEQKNNCLQEELEAEKAKVLKIAQQQSEIAFS